MFREKLSELSKLLEIPSPSLTGRVLKRLSSLDEGPAQNNGNTTVPALGMTIHILHQKLFPFHLGRLILYKHFLNDFMVQFIITNSLNSFGHCVYRTGTGTPRLGIPSYVGLAQQIYL
jgi:hypothetical protein